MKNILTITGLGDINGKKFWCRWLLQNDVKGKFKRNAMFFAQTINHDKEIFVRAREMLFTLNTQTERK